MMTGYHQVPRQASFFQYSTELDPWVIKATDTIPPINYRGWDKSSPLSPPSLFDEQQDWSPPVSPPSSPPTITSIKKPFKPQQFISTSSHVDPWTVINDAAASKDIQSLLDDDNLQQPNLYKTELCRSFMETHTCRYGVKCQFAHGKHEQRPVIRHPKYKTEICKTFHTLGTCPYGIRCRFIHTRPSDADGSPDTSGLTTPTSPSSPSSPSSSPPLRSSPPSLQWSNSWSSLPTLERPLPSPVPVIERPIERPVERTLPPSPEDSAVPEAADNQPSGRRLPIFRTMC